jgi:hypothetical protein
VLNHAGKVEKSRSIFNNSASTVFEAAVVPSFHTAKNDTKPIPDGIVWCVLHWRKGVLKRCFEFLIS